MQNINKLPKLKPKSFGIETKSEEKKPRFNVKSKDLFLTGLFVGAFACIFIYLALCFQAERVLRSHIFATLQEIGANGFGVSHSPVKSSYFALKSGVYLDDLIITAPLNMGGSQLKLGRLLFVLSPFSPRQITISAQGTHAIVTQKSGQISVMIDKADVVILLSQTKQDQKMTFSLTGFKVTASSLYAGLSLQNARLHISFGPLGSVPFDVSIEDLKFPQKRVQNLPQRLDYLSIAGAIVGSSEKRVKPLFQDWLDNSGTIEITSGEMIYPPFKGDFSGSLFFDPSLKATMALMTKMYGFFDIMDMLEKQNAVRLSHLSVAKVVLGVQLMQAEDEKRPHLITPISYQDNKVYAGQVLLFDENETRK